MHLFKLTDQPEEAEGPRAERPLRSFAGPDVDPFYLRMRVSERSLNILFFQDLSIIGRGKHATLQLPSARVGDRRERWR